MTVLTLSCLLSTIQTRLGSAIDIRPTLQKSATAAAKVLTDVTLVCKDGKPPAAHNGILTLSRLDLVKA